LVVVVEFIMELLRKELPAVQAVVAVDNTIHLPLVLELLAKETMAVLVFTPLAVAVELAELAVIQVGLTAFNKQV
jgi:hypothetical protein